MDKIFTMTVKKKMENLIMEHFQKKKKKSYKLMMVPT